MPRPRVRWPTKGPFGRLRSVRARTTVAAMAVVAVVLVAAVAGLATAVERSLTDRLQAEGTALVEAVVSRLDHGLTPPAALKGALQTARSAGGSDEVPTYVSILDRFGHPVFGSGFFNMPGMEEGAGGGVTATETADGEPLIRVGSPDLVVAQQAADIDGELFLVVAASPLAGVVHSVEAIIGASMVGVPLLTLLVGVVTWTATGWALRPIERIRAEVEELSSRTLDRRVPVPASDDEVARLATTMNGMLARLEAASARQREFVSDASHELRSPVAAIRAELEVALAHPEAGRWHDVATGVLAETGRVERMVEEMLILARLDESAGPAVAGIVDVGGIVREAAARADGGSSVVVEVTAPDGLSVNGTAPELRSVVGNLLDNAVRHATATVRIAATGTAGAVVITVDDDGPGIRPADRERVFQRFTRLENARARTEGGVGLGLAVVDRVVTHRAGSVSIEDGPLGGARFVVTWPTVSGV